MPSSSPSNSDNSNSTGLATGGVVGISVGTTIGVLALAALAAWLYFRNRRISMGPPVVEPSPPPQYYSKAELPGGSSGASYQMQYDHPPPVFRAELQAGQGPYELSESSPSR